MAAIRHVGPVLLVALALVPAAAPSAGAWFADPPASNCAGAIPDEGDVDCDGYRTDREPYDNCPNIANPAQTNTDAGYTETSPAAADGSTAMVAGDADGDACDLDDDADGVADRRDSDGDGRPDARLDNCQFVRNPSQRDTNPNDGGYGDDCPPKDSDGDGVYDDVDNCAALGNTDQADGDGDSTGDACDPDDDNDTIADGSDNCPTVSNQTQQDSDGDGIGAACDASDLAPQPQDGTTQPRTSDDRRAPRASAALATRQRARDLAVGLPVAVRCDEACGVIARLELARRDARRLRLPRRLAEGTAALGGPGRTFAFLRAARKTVRRAARIGRAGVRVRLTVTIVDEAGNRRSVRRRLRLFG